MKLCLTGILVVWALFAQVTQALVITTVSTYLAPPGPTSICLTFATLGGQGATAWHASVYFHEISSSLLSAQFEFIWYFSFDSPINANLFTASVITNVVNLVDDTSVTVNPAQGAFVLLYSDTVLSVLGIITVCLNNLNELIGYEATFLINSTPIATVDVGSDLLWSSSLQLSLLCSAGSTGPSCIGISYPAIGCYTPSQCSGNAPSVQTLTIQGTNSVGCIVYSVLRYSYSTLTLVTTQVTILTTTLLYTTSSNTGNILFPKWTTYVVTQTSTSTIPLTTISTVLNPVATSLVSGYTSCCVGCTAYLTGVSSTDTNGNIIYKSESVIITTGSGGTTTTSINVFATSTYTVCPQCSVYTSLLSSTNSNGNVVVVSQSVRVTTNSNGALSTTSSAIGTTTICTRCSSYTSAVSSTDSNGNIVIITEIIAVTTNSAGVIGTGTTPIGTSTFIMCPLCTVYTTAVSTTDTNGNIVITTESVRVTTNAQGSLSTTSSAIGTSTFIVCPLCTVYTTAVSTTDTNGNIVITTESVRVTTNAQGSLSTTSSAIGTSTF
ncbi:hypothetical protein BABINDRAFT_124197, partial [Babjeviella inositovora NRRL Y-12698]